MMDEFKKQKAHEALQRRQLEELHRKYTDDVRYKAFCRRKTALACVRNTGLPYRVAYDLSGAVVPPDARYPKASEIERDSDVQGCMRRMMACRRDTSGTVVQEDQGTWNKLYDRIQERYRLMRGWDRIYSRDWFLYFGHFLTGYAIADFTEFDIYGTMGQHTDSEVQKVIQQLIKGGTE